ncbi:hypothetical protein RJI07_04455 [Mycoplasmatota bacterium WC30]
MKNAITLQVNQKSKKSQSSCIITFKGNEVVLPNKKKLSFELFFGEIIHKITNFFSKGTKLFKELMLGKGISQMKNIKKAKYTKNTQNSYGQCFGCTDPKTYIDNFRFQKEMR